MVLADNGSKIVSVYVDGQKKVMTTDATTVGEVLAKMKVDLGPGDLVEPAISTDVPTGFFNINVYRSRPITVIDGDKQLKINSALRSPGLVAESAGLTLYPEDELQVSNITDFLSTDSVGQTIIVVRAKLMHLHVDGKDLALRSQAKTVADFLKDKQIALGLSDVVSPGVSSAVIDGMKVGITRVSVATITQHEVIAKTVKKAYDSTKPMGSTTVQAAGSDGSRDVTYRIHYNDGLEVARETLTVANDVAPVAEVMLIGTKVVSSSDAVALAQQMAANKGWTGAEWLALYNLWMHESHFNPSARNGSSGACGIPQAYPCSKIAGLDAAGQISWGLAYIGGKYGDPINAWNYWQSHHSY